MTEKLLGIIITRTKMVDDNAIANKTARSMLLIVGSNISSRVQSLVEEYSQCVVFHRISGMKLNQAAQVRGIQGG